MKKVYLGQNLNSQKIFWEFENRNSCLVSGLSGSGKSYLVNQIIRQLINGNFNITVISEKAYVDFKDKSINKIDPTIEVEKLKRYIESTLELISTLKKNVEESRYTHISKIGEQKNVLILDELWSFSNLEKNLKKSFFDLIEKIIRTGRYIDYKIIMISQISRIAETEIPIRQASIIISGKTDTSELSQTLFGTDICYNTPLKPGEFVYWNRSESPQILRIVPEKVSFIERIIKKWKT